MQLKINNDIERDIAWASLSTILDALATYDTKHDIESKDCKNIILRKIYEYLNIIEEYDTKVSTQHVIDMNRAAQTIIKTMMIFDDNHYLAGDY